MVHFFNKRRWGLTALNTVFLGIALINQPFTPHLAQAQTAQTHTASPPMMSPDMGGTFKLDRPHSSLTFKVDHLGFVTYVGRFNVFDATLVLDPVKPTQSQLSVTITPESIDVVSDDVEKELKSEQFFNVEQFPEITFTSQQVVFTSSITAKVLGQLTLLGVTQPVVLNVKFNKKGINPYANVYEMGFSGTATFKRSTWGMKALIPQISDSVTVDVEAEFQKQAEAPTAEMQNTPPSREKH